ncbi:MAG: thioredoxin domain-containing protein [Thermosynechococcaceae cyanobacterium]
MHKLLKSLPAVILLVILGWFAQPAIATNLTGLKIMKEMAQEAVPYESAIASSKPTLLEFYADWCSVCQSMAPTMADLKHQYGDDLNFVMLNVDDAQWHQQMDQYDVTGVPQFSLLNSHQSLVKTLVGRIPGSILTEEFKQLS